MFRVISILFLAIISIANVQASTSVHEVEFKMIETRFEKIKPLIVKIADQQGVHSGLLTTIAYRETRFNPRAKNKQGSTAKGLVQMVDGTKREMLRLHGEELGLAKNANIHNPKVALLLATAYINDIESDLKRRLKRQPTHAELYLAYRFGSTGAYQMLKHNPKRAKAYMRSYANDAAFYSAKVAPPPKEEKKLAFVESVKATPDNVVELQEIYFKLYNAYSPVTGKTLLENNKETLIDHSKPGLVLTALQVSAGDSKRHVVTHQTRG